MSRLQATNYEIPRTSGVCAATGRALEPGEAYYAALVEPPATDEASDAPGDAEAVAKPSSESAAASARDAADALGIRRVDVSLEAWRDGYRPEGLFCYWKSTVPQPNEKKRVFVDDAVLMNLLERLAETTDPRRLAFRYVVALILMRKRLLRYDGVAPRSADDPDAPDRWLLTPKLDLSKGPLGKWDESRRLEVVDPGLDESQIEQVTQQLGEILEAEL